MIRLAQAPFLSVQGEGVRTGKLTIFVRFFGCNLRCPGFFQKNPTDPSTYVKPLLVDPKSFKTLEEFPVVEYGCDTLYAIDPKFKHLAINYTNASAVVDAIEALLPKYDGKPSWINSETNNDYDLCFTGGEPLLQQKAISEILEVIYDRAADNLKPNTIQFETNGTQELNDVLKYTLEAEISPALFNVSPKLFSVSGEPKNKAWFPGIISDFMDYGDVSLKFVVNDTEAAFNELDERVKEFNSIALGSCVPVYVMPVGSSFEQQNDYKVINKISRMAIERGYNISGRLHCILFGNEVDR